MHLLLQELHGREARVVGVARRGQEPALLPVQKHVDRMAVVVVRRPRLRPAEIKLEGVLCHPGGVDEGEVPEAGVRGKSQALRIAGEDILRVRVRCAVRLHVAYVIAERGGGLTAAAEGIGVRNLPDHGWQMAIAAHEFRPSPSRVRRHAFGQPADDAHWSPKRYVELELRRVQVR